MDGQFRAFNVRPERDWSVAAAPDNAVCAVGPADRRVVIPRQALIALEWSGSSVSSVLPGTQSDTTRDRQLQCKKMD
jgi:hypothetical protein